MYYGTNVVTAKFGHFIDRKEKHIEQAYDDEDGDPDADGVVT